VGARGGEVRQAGGNVGGRRRCILSFIAGPLDGAGAYRVVVVRNVGDLGELLPEIGGNVVGRGGTVLGGHVERVGGFTPPLRGAVVHEAEAKISVHCAAGVDDCAGGAVGKEMGCDVHKGVKSEQLVARGASGCGGEMEPLVILFSGLSFVRWW
jgi:hypothetical protein